MNDLPITTWHPWAPWTAHAPTEREFLAADKRRFVEQMKTMQPVSGRMIAWPSANWRT